MSLFYGNIEPPPSLGDLSIVQRAGRKSRPPEDAGVARDLEASKLAHFLTQFHISNDIRLFFAVCYEHTEMTKNPLSGNGCVGSIPTPGTNESYV
jgi:hypothetical protein